MQVKLSDKVVAKLKKVTDRNREFENVAETIEFVLDRFLKRRASISKWQDEHGPKPKSKRAKKAKAKPPKKIAKRKAAKKTASKPKRSPKAKANGAEPQVPNSEEHQATEQD